MARPYEQRVYPRYQARKIVTYEYQGRHFLTVTNDLGLGGMQLRTCHCLPKDEELAFSLVLGGTTIRAKGRVAHTRLVSMEENLSGIEFVGMPIQDLIQLDESFRMCQGGPGPRRSTDAPAPPHASFSSCIQ